MGECLHHRHRREANGGDIVRTRIEDEARGRALALVCIGMLLPSLGQAQESASAPRDEASRVSVRGSLGMTAGPETFNMTLEVPWAADPLVSVGPMFQLGFSDDHTLFAPTVQAYLTPQLAGELADWHPYAHMGIGLMYLEDEDRRPFRDDEDVDFLINTGVGVEYALSRKFFMGTGLLFDVIPAGAVGNRFVFGWQILTFRAAF